MPGARRHSVFHPLRVACVERLTDDAVAVTFDVPPELREEFRFQAGQHVSIRSPVVGDDVRRNYSICAPATSGPLRIGVKRIPGGVFSSYAADPSAPAAIWTGPADWLLPLSPAPASARAVGRLGRARGRCGGSSSPPRRSSWGAGAARSWSTSPPRHSGSCGPGGSRGSGTLTGSG